MKNRYMAMLAAFIFPVLVGFTPDWTPFESKELAFNLQFPGKPEQSSQQVKTDVGELTLYIFSSTQERDTNDIMVYMAMVTNYPATSSITSDAKEDLPAMFRNAVDGGVKNVKGTLLSEKDITLKGYPGREYRISYMDGEGIIVGKMYLVKRRMYMIQVVTTKDNVTNKEVAKFLNSFSLLNT